MPAGDLITADGQAELRGLLIGRGTSYAVSRWAGLGLPKVRSDDVELESTDGAAGGLDLYEPRSISADVGIFAADRASLGVLRDALAAAFVRVDGVAATVPFVVRLAGTSRLAHARPRRLELPWERWEPHGLTLAGAFELWAADPYLYSPATVDTVVTIADGATAATGTVTNDGNGRTLPTLTLDGPAANPTVTNLATGRALRTAVTLGTTDTLVVTQTHDGVTMALNGTAGWWGTADSEVVELVPGAQDITYNRDASGVPADLTVTHRHAWVSL